jgi:hypothetical protein
MDNQSIFVIILLVIFLTIRNSLYVEGFISDSILYPSNIISCDSKQTEDECNKGYGCVLIKEKIKAYPLKTPYCTGNILDVPIN